MDSHVNEATSTSTKRHRTSNSSPSSNDDTPYRKKPNSGRYAPLEDFVPSDSDTDTDTDITGRSNLVNTNTPKIDKIFNMADKNDKGSVVIPEWAKFQTQLQDSMKTIVETVAGLSKKIDDLVDSNKFLEVSIEKNAQCTLDLKAENNALKAKLEDHENVIRQQAKRLDEAESYSKKYNLKFFNIPEHSNENQGMLKNKIGEILSLMNVDIRSLYIDNLHRLPSNRNGPRPVIVKFVSRMDRQHVWENKHHLGLSGSKVYLREHFNSTIEKNIRILLPFRRAAIDQGRKVRLIEDRLTIDSQTYTVNNLHTLPKELSPAHISSKNIDDCHFFFSASSPLSNFHPSQFTIERETYEYGEEYIQAQKAKLFNDDESYAKIRAAKSPGEMKALGSKVTGFSRDLWAKYSRGVAKKCHQAKFSQNEVIKKYLLETGTQTLVEAAPKDSLWGIGIGLFDPNIMAKRESWGDNIQGLSLMETRDYLRDTTPST